MRRAVRAFAAAVLASLVVGAGASASAQGAAQDGAAGAARSVLDGVYTAAQAANGKAVFVEVCSACHSSGQFSGLVALWAGRTVYDLYEQLRTTMPYDGPGRLSGEEYAAVVAYLMSLGGYPAGFGGLTADPAVLKQIRIVGKG